MSPAREAVDGHEPLQETEVRVKLGEATEGRDSPELSALTSQRGTTPQDAGPAGVNRLARTCSPFHMQTLSQPSSDLEADSKPAASCNTVWG